MSNRSTKGKKRKRVNKEDAKLQEMLSTIRGAAECFDGKHKTICETILNSILEACETTELKVRMVQRYGEELAEDVTLALQTPDKTIHRKEFMVHGKDSRTGVCPLFLENEYSSSSTHLEGLKSELSRWKERIRRFLKEETTYQVHFNCHETGAGGFAPIIMTNDVVLCEEAKTLIKDAVEEVRRMFAEHVKQEDGERKQKFEILVHWQDNVKNHEVVARTVQSKDFSNKDHRKELESFAKELVHRIRSKGLRVSDLKDVSILTK